MEFDPRPVYEEDQVITLQDLLAIRNGYIVQYQASKWYQFHRKWMFRLGAGICEEFIAWVQNGKTGKETIQ